MSRTYAEMTEAEKKARSLALSREWWERNVGNPQPTTRRPVAVKKFVRPRRLIAAE